MKKHSKTLFSLIIFFLSYTVYVLTAAPGVTFTDSGELAGVCVTLGIAHPTGYPLFVLLGHLWTFLPLPYSFIYSLNLFVGMLTALSSVVFFRVLLLIFNYFETKEKRKKINPNSLMLIGFASAMTYSYATTIWAQGVALEVYSLQLLVFNLIIHEIFKASSKKENSEMHYFVGVLFIGLGFSNHMTTLLVLPAVIFLFFKNPGEKPELAPNKFALLLMLIIPLFVGLSLYLYLPLRAAINPEFNWGWVSRSWDKFIYHVQGKQYQIWMFSDSSYILINLKKFINLVPYQLGWIGIVPFLYGLYRSFKLSGSMFIFLLLLIVSCLVYSLNYSIHDIDSYFSLAFIAILIFMAIGIYGLAQINYKYVALFFAIPVISLVMNYSANNRSDEYLVPEYTKNLVDNLDSNAVIISSQWDYWCSAFWYYQRVEGYRSDVTLIENELLRRTWFPNQLLRWYPNEIKPCFEMINEFMKDLELFESGKKYSQNIQASYENMINCFIDTHYGNKPIYITLDVIQKEPGIARNYQKIPQGFAFRLEKEQKVYPVSVDGIHIEKFIKSSDGKDSHLVTGISELFSLNIAIVGNYARSTNQIDVARKAFTMALEVDPNNSHAQNGLEELNKTFGNN